MPATKKVLSYIDWCRRNAPRGVAEKNTKLTYLLSHPSHSRSLQSLPGGSVGSVGWGEKQPIGISAVINSKSVFHWDAAAAGSDKCFRRRIIVVCSGFTRMAAISCGRINTFLDLLRKKKIFFWRIELLFSVQKLLEITFFMVVSFILSYFKRCIFVRVFMDQSNKKYVFQKL